jgi:hypothetical protein
MPPMGHRPAPEAPIWRYPTARRLDVLAQMICAHVLGRSAYSESARDQADLAPVAILTLDEAPRVLIHAPAGDPVRRLRFLS